MAIDLGNLPVGTPPTTGEKAQILSAIGGNLTAGPVTSLNGTSSIVDGSIGVAKLGGLGTNVSTALIKPIGTNGAVQLVGEPMYPSGLYLADVTNRVMLLNEIGLKNGKLAVGDGDTMGGNIVSADSSNTLRGTTTIPATRLNCEVGNICPYGDITQSGQLSVNWQNYTPSYVNITLSVAVTLGETPYSYNRKIVAAVNADATFSATHVAYNCGGIIQIQDKTPNLSRVYSFSVNNGTAAGIMFSSIDKSAQLAFIELGEFQILTANSVLFQKFLLTGKASIISTGGVVGKYLGLRVSESSFFPNSTTGLNFPITSGGGAVTHNYYEFNSPAKLANGNGAPAGSAYLSNSIYTGNVSLPGFIVETSLNGAAVQSVTNLVPNLPGGTNYGYTKLGRAGTACFMISCAINLTGTASAVVGVDLKLTPF